jgi:hypothetical protein
MIETGYLWLVLCPPRGGYEIQNSETGEITYVINSEYKNIAGFCREFETGEEYEPFGVILTQSSEIPLVENLSLRVRFLPIILGESLSQSNKVQVLPLKSNVTDFKDNTFTIIAVDKSVSLAESSSSGLAHPKLTVEFTAYTRNVS